MNDRVECYAGASYPEEPRVVWYEGRLCQVVAILDRRREPDGLGFLVKCSPNNALFDLYYQFETESWRVQSKGNAPLNEEPSNKPDIQGE